jgi:hypothetical protein
MIEIANRYQIKEQSVGLHRFIWTSGNASGDCVAAKQFSLKKGHPPDRGHAYLTAH